MSGNGAFSGNKSKQRSQSRSEDFGTDIWGPQQGYLQSLYGAGQGLANGPQMGGMGLGNAQQNAGFAQQGLMNSNQNLQQFQGQGVDPSVDSYSQRIGQQFNEQFLPGLQGQAIEAGGLGGSRQQIGAALGADRGMQAIGDFAANAYSGQQQRGLQAAGMQGQNSQALGQLGNQNLQNAQFGQGMPWYNQQMFAGLLGGPAMIDKGALSTSSGKSKGKAMQGKVGFL
jgi:hypothetical protein